MGSVTRNHIEVAAAVLSRIAFAGGEGSDPEELLARWRADQIGEGILEAAAEASARETLDEILELVRADGNSFSFELMGEYLAREYATAFQLGYIVRARMEERAARG